jgi:hypothetical protein
VSQRGDSGEVIRYDGLAGAALETSQDLGDANGVPDQHGIGQHRQRRDLVHDLLQGYRIIDVTDDAVTFRARGDGTVTLLPVEFVRRFLLHALPRGFVKLRHYGLLAPGNVNTKLEAARRLLEQPSSDPTRS